MKFFKYVASAALVLLLSCASTKTVTDLSTAVNVFHDPSSKTVLVAAHRGAHMGNYENSIASTRQSIRLGVDIIEVDVRTTKDGHLVLMHDSRIDRTTTGKGKVEDLTLAEIRKFRLKAPYGRISKETVPTFEEFLKVAKGKIMVDVDMKTDNVTGILAAVEATGTSDDVFYFDDDYDQLDRIKDLDASAQIMPRARSYQMADSALTKFAPPVVHIDAGFYSERLADMLLRRKARIWSNTLGEADCNIRYGNGEEVLEKLLKYGVNMVQTNEPELLLQLLRSKGLHQ
ncbi:glycerophosphodiester phosphodiesterase family protein [Flavobacteriaceae bacterium F89]|uniref:Glycerophosphodiester phosphodiesterase family protein n=1 Tax=Cerina litoralis TaxID=2874477 RepID=A0AAE3EST0_9FLAO|nr:glycerophosphodiester phosphodiesterase family protein [Cerina litoralis]MCG2460445.1 glycerophosphodiester phosphodiesterase family protein [Cerina litoralis]